MTTRNG